MIFLQREYRGYFLLIIATYAFMFVALPINLPLSSALIALGLVLVISQPPGLEYCQRVQRWPVTLVYLGLQVVLSAVILLLSRGTGFLLLTPLVAYGVVLLGRRTLILFCLFLLMLLTILDWFIGINHQTILINVLSMVASFVFVTIFTEALHQEAHARAELNSAHQRLHDYAAQVERMATLDERNRLAREIHDNVGHYLTTINIQLEAARAIRQDDPVRADSAVEKAQLLTREGLRQIRDSVAALHTLPTEQHSLPEALHLLIQTAQTDDLAIALHEIGTLPQLSSQCIFTLYRLVQEGLTNVRKHASARQVTITLEHSAAQTIKLSIADDGVGTADPTTGFGLPGAHERVQALGGEMHVHSAPGEGFTLEVEVPV